MAAKLKVTDPNGKLVFDSSRDRVMSFIKSELKAIALTGTGYEATHRISHPDIKPNNTFVAIEFYSWQAASNVISIYGSGGYRGFRVTYSDGYADVTFPWMSVYQGQTATLTYTVKAFRI